MSLQVWLPLNKNVIENKGLTDVTITNNGATFVDAGIESCYQIVGQQITFPTTNLQFMEMKPGKSFSVAFWAKGAQDDGYWLFATSNWEFKFRATLISVYANNVSGSTISYTQTTTSTQWRHITFTWDGNSGNKLSLYVDGTLVGTSSFSSSSLNLSSYFQLIHSGTRYLSDFRIYDHALSDKEVYELAKGLMFHLKLDSTDLYDCSGYGWSINKNGTLTEENDSPRYSKNIKFGGHNCYASTTNLGSEDTPRTFAFWYKPNSNNASYNTITSNNGPHTGFWLSSNTESYGLWCYINGLYVRANYQTYLTNNTWYHIVWEYKGNNQYQWYLNGEPLTTTTGGTLKAPIFTGTLIIGGAYCTDSATSSNKYDQYGSISDFRIYRTALTDEQVRELYKVGGSIDNHGNAHCYEMCEDKENYFLALMRNTNASNNVAYTFDSGKTWIYKSISGSSPSVRVSQNLKNWVVSSFNSRGWYSTDFGETLNQLPIQMDYATISNGGNVISGVKSMGARATYRAELPFTTYSTIYTATQDIWTPPTINYDGSLIIGRTNSNKSTWKYDNGTTSTIFSGSTAMGQPDIASISNIIYLKAGTYLYRSNDKGITWITLHSNLDSNVNFDDSGSNKVSNSGEYFIMHAQNNNKIIVFWNYGENYRIIETNGTKVISSCSSSGRYMCYTVDMNVFISTDYGQSFHQITTPASLTTSGDGTSVTIEDADEYEIIKNS